MTNLLWPGDHRAGAHFSDDAFLDAMVRVENAWQAARGLPGVPEGLVGVSELATAAESGGNPVIPLVKLLRSRSGVSSVHDGLTSQDVLDTALVLCLHATVTATLSEISGQIAALARLADEHRDTPMAGRTLTQHAIPITFGLKVAGWLDGVCDARDRLAALTFPVQIGGAAGSLAAPTALAGSPARAQAWVAAAAASLELTVRTPWHTNRAPLTAAADALVSCTDAWGRIANDVLVGVRPEIAELTDGSAGGSSAMPNKRNPTLPVLVRRAALAAPPLAATLHTASANAVDERPDGSWHVEWDTLRTLARRTLVAASHTAELLTSLRADPVRMAETLSEARPGIDAEQDKYGVEGPYQGATDLIIDAALSRSDRC